MSGPAVHRRADLPALAAAAAFLGCIVASNVFIAHVGTSHGAGQPHTIPVGFGLSSPSGALLAGASFTVRDAVQHRLGLWITMALIAGGAVLSAGVSPALGLASGVSFLLSETADLLVYTPLRRHSSTAAVILSNTAGAAVDTVVFLLLAYGWAAVTDFGAGQVVAKLASSVVVAAAVLAFAALWRTLRRDKQHGLTGPDSRIEVAAPNIF